MKALHGVQFGNLLYSLKLYLYLLSNIKPKCFTYINNLLWFLSSAVSIHEKHTLLYSKE